MSHTTELSETKRQLLAQYLRGQNNRISVDRSTGRRPPDDPAALSLAQGQMWHHARQSPELTCYNEPITIHRKGPLELSILERSLMQLLVRHESWRTTFPARDGKPVQVVLPPAPITVPFDDLSHLPEPSREAEALKLATQDACIQFDLERGPLFRPRVVRLSDNDYRLFVTVHHLILDGVTVFDIFFSELATTYDALAAGKTPSFPDLPFQYADFAYRQRQQLTGDVIEREVQYWRKQLSGLPDDSLLPADISRRAAQTFEGAIHSFVLPERLTAELGILSQQQGVTPFITLLAGFVILLNRYTSQPDIVIGTVTPGGRKSLDVQRVMGLFENRLPLRFKLVDDPSLLDLLVRVRNVVSEALSHDDVPFEIVADQLNPECDMPFYEIIFSLVPPLPDVGPGWGITTMNFDPGGARVGLNIELDNRPSGILGSIQFSRDLFTEETIARLARDYESTLEALVHCPTQRLSQLGASSLNENRSTVQNAS
jgi:hypothetical protein